MRFGDSQDGGGRAPRKGGTVTRRLVVHGERRTRMERKKKTREEDRDQNEGKEV